jgi:TolA-binding protein
MDDLARLEGELGFEQLEGEEKSIFSQFFDNMARIRTLRAKLKQLEHKEDLLEEEKRHQKLEEQNEERRKRLQEMQGEREPGAGPWVGHHKTSLSKGGGAGGGNPFPPRGRPSILLRAALLPQPSFRRNPSVVAVGDAGEGVGAERGQGQARA